MKVLLSWLDEYFIDKPNWDIVFDKLTQAGIEIEKIEPINSETNGLEDKLIELKITPNRGDCLSILGLLREISVLTGYKHQYQMNHDVVYSSDAILDVTVDAKNECPNYTVIIIENVDNTVKLPDIITRRLTLCGCNSISPIVDIANYVMLEMGQPLHTFDLDKTGSKLYVRMANDGETLTLLDNTNAKLTNNTLLICDSNDKPAAIAGVMGGLDSGVSINTKNIIVESAFFTQNTIIGKVKQYEINSDAAYRFERGVDYKIQEYAIRFAASLISKYLGGKVSCITIRNNLANIYDASICVKEDDFARLIGIDIPIATIRDILTKLGFEIKSDADKLIVIPPSYRFDIKIKEDLIEEVARVYGYDNIEAKLPTVTHTMMNINQDQAKINILKNNLVVRGYNEIISYAFLEEDYFNLFNYLQIDPVGLKNPIAGLSFMRNTLFAGLIKTMQYNINRGAASIKLFELSRVFYGEDEKLQPLKLSGLLYGYKNKVNWSSDKEQVDFFDIKGDVELLLQHIEDIKFMPCLDNKVLHSGRCAKICTYNRDIGIIGQLHPYLSQKLGLSLAPYLFELDIDFIINNDINFKVKPINKFQKVERDLAFVMDINSAVGDIVDYIHSLKIDSLIEINIFDVYSGDNLGFGQKSVAIKLLFQANKTLTDDEISQNLNYIIEQVSKQFKVKLR
ncbi:MAG: phenylalanine--tRNA ligase subunit beta [Neisseriaceae bacterium]